MMFDLVALLLHLCLACAAAGSYQTVELNVNLVSRHAISEHLYGIFFEEIGHAGEGGLYAELIQDSAFSALALQTGFQDSNAEELLLDKDTLASGMEKFEARLQAARMAWADANVTRNSKSYWLKQQGLRLRSGKQDSSNQLQLGGLGDQFTQPISWSAVQDSTRLSLIRQNASDDRLGAHRALGLKLSPAPGAGAGQPMTVLNSGYWGIPVEQGASYALTLRARLLNASHGSGNITVALVSASRQRSYASVTFAGLGHAFEAFSARLKTQASDSDAYLAISATASSPVVIEWVSLLPAANVEAQGAMQNPYPFRADLLKLLQDLQPRFIRMPGGCYVEGGDHLANAFRWKPSTGHLNAIWGYWSNDGLGIFEYMLLAEELKAEPVWVFNSGNSHTEQVPNPQIGPWVQDALDSIEFMTGHSNSTWGSLRAAMGRSEPWQLNYMAIGNEYIENYRTFWNAIKAAYPHMRLISDCDLTGQAPQDEWDWHVYTTALDLFNKQHDFDNARPDIFASEYAVTVDSGWGNLKAAIAEAAFMTGLERNSPTVRMAAYAPLLVNTHNRAWNPDMIVFNNRRAYGIPSYHVQQLFSQHAGMAYAESTLRIAFGDVHNLYTAASTTCQDLQCSRFAIKVVNTASFAQDVNIHVVGLSFGYHLDSAAKLTTLTGTYAEQENTFEHPWQVSPETRPLGIDGSSFTMTAPPYSLNILQLTASETTQATLRVLDS